MTKHARTLHPVRTRADGTARAVADWLAYTITRRALARLDDDILHGIGLSRDDLTPNSFERIWAAGRHRAAI